MNSLSRREQLLAQRRRMLVAASRARRGQIVEALSDLQPALGGVERALGVGNWVRRHAVWIGAAGAALMLIKRPRGLLRMATRAWSVWRGLRALGL